MKKYKNWGTDLGGLSRKDSKLYRKIYYAGRSKKDLLDVVETVPLNYAYDLTDDVPSPEDNVFTSELKNTIKDVLLTLNPREERVLRMRFGIGMNTDHTLEEVGQKFSVTRNRIRQIQYNALQKMKHKLVSFVDAD